MKVLFIILTTLVKLNLTYCQQSASYHFTSINTMCNAVNLDFPPNADVIIRETAGSYIRVEVAVIANAPYQITETLGNMGRYKVIADSTSSIETTLHFGESLNRVIITKGQELKEQFRIIVYLPKHVRLVNQIAEK